MNLSVIIPVRPPEEGKSRLASALSPAAREALVEELFRHVLNTALAVGADGGVRVVSSSARLLGLAREAGAMAVVEQGCGLNPAVAQAMAACHRDRPLLALSADLPLVTPEDIACVAETLTGADIVAATDRAGRGTNALGLRRPDLIMPAFGNDSLSRHRELARAAGLRFAVLRRDGLASDLDVPEDLALLGSRINLKSLPSDKTTSLIDVPTAPRRKVDRESVARKRHHIPY